MMRRIYLAQINNSFGDNAFLPYSAALLWSHASTRPSIASSWQLGGLLWRRDAIESALDAMADPDLLAVSCYLWNWRYNMALIDAAVQRWPNLQIVLGGPEVPDDSGQLLQDMPHITAVVHGEGEETFADLLEVLCVRGDLGSVRGISWRRDGISVRNAERARLVDLDSIPSPYLSGLFDVIMSQHPEINWHASQETHRGCPYSCTFCDWGSAVYTKVRTFGQQRLLDEIDWFADKRIDLLYNCDANYGIYKRDIDLTTALVAAKQHKGYPRKFRASYAKKSDEKVFEIAKLLNDAGMSKGVTLSMQSMDPITLQNVKRSNIAVNHFRELTQRYRTADIPAYTEIILGLPGESLHSFTSGLEALLAGGQHDNINVYLCMLLRNSEMAEPDYVRQHGLITATLPLTDNHRSDAADDIPEFHDVVIATKTMPHADWLRAHELSWMVQALHCLGLTQLLAQYHAVVRGDHMGFYQRLLREHRHSDTLLGQQIQRFTQQVQLMLAGADSWHVSDDRFGPIRWPHEEMTFMQLRLDADRFYEELKPQLDWLPAELVDQLLRFQKLSTLSPDMIGDEVDCYDWDLLLLRDDLLQGKVTLHVQPTLLRFASDQYYHGQGAEWARDRVWYGRKQALLRTKITREGK